MKNAFLEGMSQRVVAYQPILTKLTGRLTAGILLSQIVYWWPRRKGDSVYKTNEEFCDETGMTLDELKAAKKILLDKGYISVVKRGVPQRSHYMLHEDFLESQLVEIPPTHSGNPTVQMVEIPPTNSEITTKNTTEVVAPSKEGLPVSLGKSQTARIASVYGLLFKEKYQTDYKVSNWPALTKLYKPLLKDFSEWQVAALIILHFDWRGASGQDEFVYRRLSEKRFPLEWVPKALNEYRPYFQEHMGFSFDDEETIKRHVTAIIKPLYQKYGQPNS